MTRLSTSINISDNCNICQRIFTECRFKRHSNGTVICILKPTGEQLQKQFQQQDVAVQREFPSFGKICRDNRPVKRVVRLLCKKKVSFCETKTASIRVPGTKITKSGLPLPSHDTSVGATFGLTCRSSSNALHLHIKYDYRPGT